MGSGNIGADTMQIMPMVIVCLVACVILLLDGCVPAWRRTPALNPIASILGLLGALYFTINRMISVGDGAHFADGTTAFAGGVAPDTLFAAASIALLVTGLLSVLLASSYLRSRNLEHGEYYVLLLFSIAGAMLMAAANDLIVLFLGLEVLSFALYVMAGFARTDEKSEESSIKYFLLGAFASAFLLYGIALLYGATQYEPRRHNGRGYADEDEPPVQPHAAGGYCHADGWSWLQGCYRAVPPVDAGRIRGSSNIRHRLHGGRGEDRSLCGYHPRLHGADTGHQAWLPALSVLAILDDGFWRSVGHTTDQCETDAGVLQHRARRVHTRCGRGHGAP